MSKSLTNALSDSISLDTFDAALKSKMADVSNNTLLINKEVADRIASEDALVTSLNLVQVGLDQNNAALSSETALRMSADQALVLEMDNLTASHLANNA